MLQFQLSVLAQQSNYGTEVLWLAIVGFMVVFVTMISLLTRYKRCPSDRVLVIYGKVGQGSDGNRSARCVHGGAAFIFPIIQDYQFLDLTPITMDIDLRGALSLENIRIDAPSTFTVGVSTEPGIMENAAERLLGLRIAQIQSIAEDILFGQTRVVIATMTIQEIISNRDKFVDNITSGVGVELTKIGLKLINVNVKDINDESGYIEALGKEAAAKAINEAKKAVAERTRDGEIGMAQAQKEQRIQVASANAQAVGGENTAKIEVANSDANRRDKEAQAERQGTAAEKVQTAKALEESYVAEQLAEVQRAERERATQVANIVVPAEIEKEKVQIDADAVAERYRREAKGQADAILAKLQAEAEGNREILVKQAEGLKALVSAAQDNPNMAALLMITDKLPELVKTQVEAISNLKIDKVTVWDSGTNSGDGTPTTAKFAAGLLQSLPPLQNMFDMAGMKLPDIIDVSKEDEASKEEIPSKETPPKKTPRKKKEKDK